MTKWLNDQHKYKPDNDTPISVPNFSQIENRVDHFCPYCSLKLSRILDSSGLNPNYYCSKCTIEYPAASETKSKSQLSTPVKSNDENPLATTKFQEPTIGKTPVTLKGGFAELAKKGTIKIKDYTESKG